MVKEENEEDSLPVLKSGSCYSFSTTNLKKWYDLFSKYYYEKVADKDPNENIFWDDKPMSTLIKYSKKDTNFSLTITLHNNGTVTIQGPAKSLEIWQKEHYPELLEMMKSATPTDKLSTKDRLNEQ